TGNAFVAGALSSVAADVTVGAISGRQSSLSTLAVNAFGHGLGNALQVQKLESERQRTSQQQAEKRRSDFDNSARAESERLHSKLENEPIDLGEMPTAPSIDNAMPNTQAPT